MNRGLQQIEILSATLVTSDQLAPLVQPLETVTLQGSSQLPTTKAMCALWVGNAQNWEGSFQSYHFDALDSSNSRDVS